MKRSNDREHAVREVARDASALRLVELPAARVASSQGKVRLTVASFGRDVLHRRGEKAIPINLGCSITHLGHLGLRRTRCHDQDEHAERHELFRDGEGIHREEFEYGRKRDEARVER